MIYIDPPYNTGKDFVYHDNFKASTEEYDEATEYKDEEGNIQYKKNEKSNGRYHSDWLSMMYPRLKLARNLLSQDGVIFISIDDNEQANLKKLCDEIFGEENFVENLVWLNKEGGGGSDSAYFKKKEEYIFVYAKNIDNLVIYGIASEEDSSYAYQDKYVKERGKYKLIKLNSFSIQYSTSLDYEIEMPNDEVVKPTENGKKGCWRWSKKKLEWGIQNDFIEFRPNQEGKMWVYTKQYFKVDNNGRPIKRTLPPLSRIDEYSSTRATKDLEELLGPKTFDYAKPYQLIKYLAQIATKENSIIFDFFSGSGTTAHAAMQLNAEDGGNRKWIMVQLPEETPEGSEARKAGYNTIPEIARERIRRAGDKIAKEHPDAKVDYGFRSLVVADTSFKDVYKPVSEVSQASLLETVDNIKEDRTALDLLYSVLVQLALELNRPIETRDISGSTVYLYDYLGEVSGLTACFSEKVSEDAIKHIASLKPLTAVFRDSSFVNSQAKVNLAEHFRVISPDTKVRVI